MENVIPTELSKLLHTRVPEDAPGMIEQVSLINGYTYGIVSQLADVKKRITQKSRLPLKSKAYTEMDRKMMLAQSIIEEQYELDILEGTMLAIKERISIVQSALKYLTEEFKRNNDGRIQ